MLAPQSRHSDEQLPNPLQRAIPFGLPPHPVKEPGCSNTPTVGIDEDEDEVAVEVEVEVVVANSDEDGDEGGGGGGGI